MVVVNVLTNLDINAILLIRVKKNNKKEKNFKLFFYFLNKVN